MIDPSQNVVFLRSTDGISWQAFTPKHRQRNISYFDLSLDGGTTYAVDNSIILKSTDGGASWTQQDLHTSLYAVTTSPVDPNRVLYGTAPSHLYLSTDSLQTSRRVLTRANNAGHIADIVFAPSDPQIVYTVTVGYDFYQSTNASETFVKLGNLRHDVLNKTP